MPLWKRKVALIVGVASGSLALATLGDLASLGQTFTVAIAALGLALVIVVGGPWAFGDGRFALQHGYAVEPYQAAMVAGNQEGRKSGTHGHIIFVEAVEDDLFIEGRPIVLPAGPAFTRGPFIKGKAELVEVTSVGHDDDDTRG